MTETLPKWFKDDSIIFYSSKDPYFELSNMCSGMPILLPLSGQVLVFNSSEALYQACKYPPDLGILPKESKTTIANVRDRILASKTPMQAKMTQKCAKDHIRHDWYAIRNDVMLSVIVLKLYQHPRFRMALLDTKGKHIVEKSRKDTYWGALDRGDYLEGQNHLGTILVKVRNNEQYYVNEGYNDAVNYLRKIYEGDWK